MPFVPNTPESHSAILSPNATVVCCGVSNDGKPCKRTLVRNASGDPQSGTITIVAKNQPAYFCARHEDQAKDVVLRHTASFARRRAMVGRGSLDTLIEQVEVLVSGQPGQTTSTTIVSTTKPVAPAHDPFRPPLATTYEDPHVPPPRPPSPPTNHHAGGRKKRHGLLMRLFMCCCISDDNDKEKNWSERRREAELRSAAAAVVEESFPKHPPQAHQKRDSRAVAFQSVPPTPPLPMLYPAHQQPQSAIAKHPAAPTARAAGLSPATPQSDDDDDEEEVTPVDVSHLPADQQALLKLIPSTVHPHGLGRLQQEVLRPFSDKDEPGYIYMFWLTDSPFSPYSTPSGTPTHTNAQHLLRAAINAAPLANGTRPKLLFKIGRAANVQRRMHQWQTQCGYNLALIRYYPHTSASSPGVGSEVGRKVPYSHRIERLIHLELSATPGANPKQDCTVCGKTHKEWFEVEASREGVIAVDEVIKRWIAFGERSAGVQAVSNPQKPNLPKVTAAGPKKTATAAAAGGNGGVKMYDKKKTKASSSGSATTSPTKPAGGKGKAPAKSPRKSPRRKNNGDDDYDDDYEDEDEDSDWSRN